MPYGLGLRGDCLLCPLWLLSPVRGDRRREALLGFFWGKVHWVRRPEEGLSDFFVPVVFFGYSVFACLLLVAVHRSEPSSFFEEEGAAGLHAAGRRGGGGGGARVAKNNSFY